MNSDLFLVHRSENGHSALAIRLKIGDQVIGRSIECEIYVPMETISRKHSRLSVSAKGVILTDLGSRNGTWINGQRIQCVPVLPGQLIMLGNVRMVLSYDPNGECGLDSEEDTRDARDFLLKNQSTLSSLSKAQTRVFNLLVKGMIEKQVAIELGISPHTVHNHARKIYEAYDVRSRIELLLKVMPHPKGD